MSLFGYKLDARRLTILQMKILRRSRATFTKRVAAVAQLRAMYSHHRESTTDAEGLACDKGSIWRCQEGDSSCNLFWSGQPSQRGRFNHRFDDAFTTGSCLKGFQKGRLGWTRCQAVNGLNSLLADGTHSNDGFQFDRSLYLR